MGKSAVLKDFIELLPAPDLKSVEGKISKMERVKSFLRYFWLFLMLIPALPAVCQDANPLPNAPVPDHASSTSHIAPNKWYGVVDPGPPAPEFGPGEKMIFWLHEQASPLSLIPLFSSAGYAQVVNGDPKYGSDSGAFGERLGAIALRQASMRFFSDSLFPTIMRTDPRYFRMGSGPVVTRGLYAVKRLVITQNDSGQRVVNYSDLAGRLAGAGLTAAYYPEASINATVVARTWGTSVGGAAVGNLFDEFWPDIRDAVFHHNRKSARMKDLSADSVSGSGSE